MTSLSAAIGPLLTLDLSNKSLRDYIYVHTDDTLHLSNVAYRWTCSPTLDIAVLRSFFQRKQPLFTEQNITLLSESELSRLFQNLEALKSNCPDKESLIQRSLFQVVRNVQEKKFMAALNSDIKKYIPKWGDKPITSINQFRDVLYKFAEPRKGQELRALVERFSALSELLCALDTWQAMWQLREMVQRLSATGYQFARNHFEGFTLKEEGDIGQRFVLHGPRTESLPGKVNLGSIGSTFLRKYAPCCDVIMNLMELDEDIDGVFEPVKNLEYNYVQHLQPTVTITTEQLLKDREEQLKVHFFRTVEYLCPQEYTPDQPQRCIVHLDGMRNGTFLPDLSSSQAVAFLREVKNHWRIVEKVASEQKKNVQDLRIGVHCRHAMNRTPFYIALLLFMKHPEWVRNQDDVAIINKFIKVVQELAFTARDERAHEDRLPNESHFNLICHPLFLQALRDVVGDAPAAITSSSVIAK